MLFATIGGVLVEINSDTPRVAVEELVRAAAPADFRWHVIANKNGTINKVTFRPDRSAVPGFYCYTSDIQPVAGPLDAGVSAAR